MMRRKIALVASALVAALFTGACSADAPPVAPSAKADGAGGQGAAVTVGLTYVPNVQFTPAYFAQSKDFFREHGVEASLRHHGAQEDLFGALAAGEEQLVVAGATEAAVAAAAGQDVVLLAPYYRAYPAVLIVPADSPIQSVADLKGHSVGIPGEYGENLYALEGALAQAGLTRTEVDVQSIGYTQVAALAAGHVDAVIGFVNNEPVQAAAQGVQVRVVPIGHTDLLGAAIVTSRAALEKNPEGIRAAALALQDGIDATVASLEAGGEEALAVAKEFVPDLNGEAEAGALATLSATVPLWTGFDPAKDDGLGGVRGSEYITVTSVAAMLEALESAGVLKGEVTAGSLLAD
ncbi:ABC transporter substrate-binding protein [Buchananella felis]|uniref:ABC transporter substrate-binding protein n=1 Tax=Buchananella felis TaxID=3231492 RepID=UPI0035285DE8